MAKSGLWKITRLLLRGGVLPLIMTQSARPQSPPQVQQLMNELPFCSVLRSDLERGLHGDGIDQPYMAAMRQEGVQRALFEVHAVIHGKTRDNIRIVRRLYFREFDGRQSQISEDTTLNAFKVSGLQAELEGLARSRALTAPFHKGEFMFFQGNHVVSFVEFFASARLRELHVIWGRSGHPEPLTVAVVHGDALGTQAVLGSHRFTKKELDRALFGASLSRYDNSAVIKLLLDAGADVNAHAAEDTTPLMLAV